MKLKGFLLILCIFTLFTCTAYAAKTSNSSVYDDAPTLYSLASCPYCDLTADVPGDMSASAWAQHVTSCQGDIHECSGPVTYINITTTTHTVYAACVDCGSVIRNYTEYHTSSNSCTVCGYVMAEKCGDTLYWTFDESTGELRIYGTGDMWDFNTLNDQWSAPWAQYQTQIVSVIVEDGCASVGYAAFYTCANCTSISLPDSVASIGVNAFAYSGITSIRIPASTSQLRTNTFCSCKGLSSITIPGSVLQIDSYAFYGCTNLKEVALQEGVKTIGVRAFESTSIEHLRLPASIDYIAGNVAPESPCTAYSVATGSKYEEVNGCLYEGTTLVAIPNEGGVVYVRDGTQLIEEYAAYGSNCSVYFLPPSITEISYYSFARQDPGCVIYTYESSMFVDGTNYSASTTTLIEYLDYGQCGDDLHYMILPDGTMNIFGTGPMWDFISNSDTPWNAPWAAYQLDITSVFVEDGCTAIGNHAFFGCSSCTSIVIPEGVTTIGSHAMDGTGIADINLPSTLTSIGHYAFFACSRLETISIPEGVTVINMRTFSLCEKLSSVVLPSTLEYIDNTAFCVCSSLSSIILPDSLLSIGSYAFSGCPLENIDLPPNLQSIEASAFTGTELETLTLPASVTHVYGNVASVSPLTAYYVEEGSVFESISGVLYRGTTLVASPHQLPTIYRIPFGTTSVGEAALYLVKASEVYLPPSVSTLGVDALYSHNIDRVYTADATMFIDGTNYNASKTTLVEYLDYGQCGDDVYYMILPDGTMRVFGTGPMWDFTAPESRPYQGHTGSVTSLAVESGVTSIGDYAFYYLGELDTLSVADTVTSIGDYAFSKCGSIESITLSDTITTIGTAGFKECGSLVSINLPTSLTTLGANAFESCYSLESISIPSGVIALGNNTFYNCSSLNAITLNNTLTSIGQKCFYNNCSVCTLALPSTVTYIGDYAFATCDSLVSITLPDNITYMGTHILEDCGSLKTVNIPTSISEVPDYTLALCTYLENITIPSNITTIGAHAFQECISLRDPVLSNSVETIEDYAFDGCVSIGHLNTPSTLTTIGTGAFTNWSEGTTIKPTDPTVFVAGTHYTSPNTTIMVQSTLTLDYNDGSTASQSYKKWTYETMSITSPTRTGYTFANWSSPAYGSLSGSTYTWGTTYDVTDTLTAQWTPKEFTITWDANGGNGSTTSTQAYGSTITLPATNPTLEGYQFSGWYTAAEGGYIVLSTDTYSTDGPTTYYAHYTPLGFTTTWDRGDGTSNSILQTYGAPIIFPTEPTKQGYTFDGWYDGSTKLDASSVYNVTHESTYYAHFTPKTYTVTWDTGVGTSTSTQVFDTQLTPPTPPSRAGFAFVGWYTAETGGVRVDADTVYSVDGNTVYYAQWTKLFSVTVPATLPLAMRSDGTIVLGTSTLTNLSGGDVKIASATVSPKNGWTLVPTSTSMARAAMNSKQFSLDIQGTDMSANTSQLDWTIPYQGTLNLTYDANVSGTTVGYVDEELLTITFVITWAE